MSAAPPRPVDHRPVFVYADEHGAFRVEVTASLPVAADVETFDVFSSLQDAAAALFLRATNPGQPL